MRYYNFRRKPSGESGLRMLGEYGIIRVLKVKVVGKEGKMKILGDPIFAKDENGRLKSRVGTIFLTVAPGLVTQAGIHAMQRQAWVDEVNRERSEQGLLELTDDEISRLVAHSVDLLFLDDVVLIRPDPDRMDLALWADEELQKLVSKRKIRFLNTHAKRVRDALRARGENWRMARDLRTREEVDKQIARGRTAIRHEAIYHYNGNTGTRYVTAGAYAQVAALPDDAFRAQGELLELAVVRRRDRPDVPVVELREDRDRKRGALDRIGPASELVEQKQRVLV